ncbi:MAG: response regulator [Lachnospiraceae bacterium]|nr:response regulator [Lachnospiraceae bacterium]
MKRILLADDDDMNLMVTDMILSEMGYEVTSAKNGRACIELLKEGHHDLLLLDIEMKDLRGLEVLKEIRSIPEISDTRTVFLTASSHREDMMDAIRLGALDFIRKPALPENLLHVVRNALSARIKDLILVVDDDPMTRMATEELFGIRYRVVCAESGEEALSCMEEEKPDLILLDFHMPGMNGLQVLEKIRENESYGNIPVIFLTADDDADTEAELFEAGAMDYIRKPYIMQVALQRIRRVLELKHLQDSLQDEVERKTIAVVESNRKIRKISQQVILALAGIIDEKDRYTRGHSTRVADYSRDIAKRMGKPKVEINDIYNIALLHDVGKVSIPRSIINTPGKLAPEEFESIKNHTVAGYDVLKTISEMPSLSVGARWHHERFDGKGYPDGIRGRDIPEIARIISVADCYDAMTSARSYRKALPQDFAREEIKRGRGSQLDPDIADIMLKMIDEDTGFRMCGGKG